MIVTAITGGVLGVYNIFKGEPKADEAGKTAVAVYETLQQKSNEHGEAINKLTKLLGKMRLQLTYSEGFKMGYKEHKAEARVLELEQRIAELQGKKKRRRPPAAGGGGIDSLIGPALASGPICKKGYVRDGKQCKKVPKAVAKAVDKVKKEALEAKRRAELERLKRKKMEQHIQRPAPAPKPMLPLPRKLHHNGKKGPKLPSWGD